MAVTATRARTRTMTRVEAMQDAAERFLELADRNEWSMNYELEKLEVLFGMKLIREIRLTIFADDERISGLRMKFDWDMNRAMFEKEGEDIAEDKIDQYGTLSSITDTMEVLRNYINELFEKCGATFIGCSCYVRHERVQELGRDRYYEIMGYKKPGEPARPPTQAELEAARKEWAADQAARRKKGTKRTFVLPELPEVSIETW